MNIIERARSWLSEKLASQNDGYSYVPADLIPMIETMTTTGMSYATLVNSYKSWVYIAIDKIAKTVAMLPLQLYTYERNGKLLNGRELKASFAKDGLGALAQKRWCKSHGVDKVLVEEHPVYELFARPNDVQTRYQLWYDTTVKLEIGGQCGWYLPQNRLGIPAEIWPLPLRSSGVLTPDLTAQGLVGFDYVDGVVRQKFTREEILWFIIQSPANFYMPFSPLMAQTYPYDIDNYLAQLKYYLFKNRAAPGMVLTTDQRLQKTQVQELIDQINTQYAGTTRAGRPMILHSGLKPGGSLITPLKDLIIESVSSEVQDKILSAYGVPAGKVGLVKDVNRANMEALDKTYMQETIRPRCMLIEEEIESHLLPRYDERLTADFVIPEMTERATDLQERRENLALGYTTINEERMREGLEEVAWGDEPWLGAGLLQPEMDRPEELPANKPDENPDDKARRRKSFPVVRKAGSVDIDFDFDDPQVQARLGNRLKQFSEEIAGTTFADVTATLREGFNEGLSLSAIADNLRQTFDAFEKGRAATIARTESVYSVTMADLECAAQNGLDETMLKYWISSRDGETRETHLAAETMYYDGIPLDAPFQVGDDSMQGPGMGMLAEEVCNCRCSLGYKNKDEKNWHYDENRWAAEAKASDRWMRSYERLFQRTARKLFRRQEREILAALESKGERLKAHVAGWSLSKIRTHLKQSAAIAEIVPTEAVLAKQAAEAFEPVYSYVVDSAGTRRAARFAKEGV